ncbi:hypothetical protein H696_02843 [Fonticula alba]|uniref:Uncharacterized protein n=1 Tax=Fonticula alba TaxID=691883 RepID=A0A058ZAP7_FONAL|nr:hypothetical protein H696_02843 [Fonticula alba]KCV70502.1 hypothetical protein H696_02843 [Fonticula alba]|eukprot:XP_009495018.1 hypothetical protein H696_02843 [Fonticula alba]
MASIKRLWKSSSVRTRAWSLRLDDLAEAEPGREFLPHGVNGARQSAQEARASAAAASVAIEARIDLGKNVVIFVDHRPAGPDTGGPPAAGEALSPRPPPLPPPPPVALGVSSATQRRRPGPRPGPSPPPAAAPGPGIITDTERTAAAAAAAAVAAVVTGTLSKTAPSDVVAAFHQYMLAMRSLFVAAEDAPPAESPPPAGPSIPAEPAPSDPGGPSDAAPPASYVLVWNLGLLHYLDFGGRFRFVIRRPVYGPSVDTPAPTLQPSAAAVPCLARGHFSGGAACSLLLAAHSPYLRRLPARELQRLLAASSCTGGGSDPGHPWPPGLADICRCPCACPPAGPGAPAFLPGLDSAGGSLPPLSGPLFGACPLCQPFEREVQAYAPSLVAAATTATRMPSTASCAQVAPGPAHRRDVTTDSLLPVTRPCGPSRELSILRAPASPPLPPPPAGSPAPPPPPGDPGPMLPIGSGPVAGSHATALDGDLHPCLFGCPRMRCLFATLHQPRGSGSPVAVCSCFDARQRARLRGGPPAPLANVDPDPDADPVPEIVISLPDSYLHEQLAPAPAPEATDAWKRSRDLEAFLSGPETSDRLQQPTAPASYVSHDCVLVVGISKTRLIIDGLDADTGLPAPRASSRGRLAIRITSIVLAFLALCAFYWYNFL